MTISIKFENGKGILLFTKNTIYDLKPYIDGYIIKTFSVTFDDTENMGDVNLVTSFLKSYKR